MKHHDPLRPVGKCKGCCLNLRTRCAAGLLPKNQWDNGNCKQYGNTQLLCEVLRTGRLSEARFAVKFARQIRKAKAIAMDTEGHYKGIFDPGVCTDRAGHQRL